MSKKIIQELTSIQGLKIECPRCSEEFSLKRGKLFNMYDAYPPNVQKILKERMEFVNLLRGGLDERKSRLVENKKKKPEKIETSARVKFVDVKTGQGRLDKRQRQIQDRILEGKIKHKVID